MWTHQLVGAQGQGDGENGGHGNGDTADNDDQHVDQGGAGLLGRASKAQHGS